MGRSKQLPIIDLHKAQTNASLSLEINIAICGKVFLGHVRGTHHEESYTNVSHLQRGSLGLDFIMPDLKEPISVNRLVVGKVRNRITTCLRLQQQLYDYIVAFAQGN